MLILDFSFYLVKMNNLLNNTLNNYEVELQECFKMAKL
jgi:hypothetical protein